MASIQIFLFCLTTLCVVYITAKPYDLNSFNLQKDLERCRRVDEVDIQCQKCAKITKSPVAYPMCCSDKEDAYVWCIKYINFGIQKRSHQKELPPWERKHLTKEQQKQELRKHLSSAEIQEMYIPDIETNML